MAVSTLNSGNRANRDTVYCFDIAGALPADAEVSTINTYLQGTDATMISVLSPLDMKPSITFTDKDTAGNASASEKTVDNFEFTFVRQTPEEIDAIIAKFDGVKCDIKELTCDSDVAVNDTTNVITASEGDIISVVQNVTMHFVKPLMQGAEKKYYGYFSKSVAGNKQIVSYQKTVIADTP